MDNPYSSPGSDLQRRDSYSENTSVNARVAAVMKTTGVWVRLVAIISTLMAGAPILILADFARGASSAGSLFAILVMLVQIVVGIILIAKLFTFASRIRNLLRSGSMLDLETALDEHRKYWKVLGIYFLVLVCLTAIPILMLIIGAR